jgi:hypothetical protein
MQNYQQSREGIYCLFAHDVIWQPGNTFPSVVASTTASAGRDQTTSSVSATRSDETGKAVLSKILFRLSVSHLCFWN